MQEYNVRASSSNDKNYFIARFASGLPNFKKKNENRWSLQKEGLQGRQVTDTLRVFTASRLLKFSALILLYYCERNIMCAYL